MSESPVQHRAQPEKQHSDIAIIGMACVFPGASNLQQYWQNIVSKVDAITDPPDDWGSSHVYDPASNENDRVYCRRGGFLGQLASFNPVDFGIMPLSIDGGEPDHYLALRLAREALADSGHSSRTIDGKAVEVVIGRGTYVNRGWATLVQHGVIIDQTIDVLRRLHPEHTEEELLSIKQQLKATLPPFNAETASGLVPNIITGRIANRLDVMGSNYIVDAACASSLIALETGTRDLLTGKCDMALVGGVQASTPPPLHMIFCQLGALSRQAQIRPFDKNADGTLLGEGAGIIVLKRREDAERDGDRIYALIKGVGTSSDGRGAGVMTPRLEGEELALQQAYRMAGISPETIELIEAHGTGTPVGDLTEIQALTRVFGSRKGRLPTCALGSVKSMISHLIPAAGIAGLIKVALALYHKVLPPTLNCDEPNPKFELHKTPFYVNTDTRPWIHGSREAPRRAGVNAFGFGGVNAHAILEEYVNGEPEPVSFHQQWDSELFIIEADSREGLIEKIRNLRTYGSSATGIELKDLAYTLNTSLGRQRYRLSIVASSLEDLMSHLELAKKRLSDPDCQQIKHRKGLYFFEKQMAKKGKLAFLFPGEGSQYPNMLADLCIHFPEVRACFDRIEAALSKNPMKMDEYLPSDYVFPKPAEANIEGQKQSQGELWQMKGAVAAVLTANQALYELLNRLDIKPQAVVGHSTGEYTALAVSGIMDLSSDPLYERYVAHLNSIYQETSDTETIGKAKLIAVGADAEQLRSAIGGDGDGLYLAMDNCPHQSVIVAPEPTVDDFMAKIKQAGFIYQILPFDRPYHTPLFTAYAEQLNEFFQQWVGRPPDIDVYSCTTTSTFPFGLDEIRKLAVDQWVSPVKFKQTICRMHDDGYRTFVEVGPRNNLTAFVNDILKDREHLTIAANVEGVSGITQLHHMLGLLAAHGIPLRLDHLYARRHPRKLSLSPARDRAHIDEEVKAKSSTLNLGLPYLKTERLKPATSGSPAKSTTPDPAQRLDSAQTDPSQSKHPESPPHLRVPPAQATRYDSIQKKQDVLYDQGQKRQGALEEYFQTMEKFLAVQQDVMCSYLTGRRDSESSELTATRGGDALPAERTARMQGQTRITPAISSDQSALGPDSQLAPFGSEPLPGPSDMPRIEVSKPSGPEPVKVESSESIEQQLLQLVSDKTGYPPEMIDPTVNLEADLGIDSIKRIEILGAFWQEHPELEADDLENVSQFKTLREIIDFAHQTLDGNSQDVPSATTPGHPQPGDDTGNKLHHRDMPMLGDITTLEPGKKLIACRTVDPREDLYLSDHTLGGSISLTDSSLTALPVMPLTMSMEIMAEAATLLCADNVLVGMKDIRTYKWIAFNEKTLTLEITAERAENGNEVRVAIFMRNGNEGGSLESQKAIDGTMVLAEKYGEPPALQELNLDSPHECSYSRERIYSQWMFHGPSWQGVRSFDRSSENGAVATLEVLSTEKFFRSHANPRFVTDHITLDAAGQVIGIWAMDRLDRRNLVFPFRVESLEIYGPPLSAGECSTCQAAIRLTGSQQVRSNIDMLDSRGRLWMRLVGWEDKRFDRPDKIYAFLLNPSQIVPSTPFRPNLPYPSDHAKYRCFYNEQLFESDEAFWKDVLASLILNCNERVTYRDLERTEKAKSLWLMARLAAKDAARTLLKEEDGIELAPADIEIRLDERDRPLLAGAWCKTIEKVPVVSFAHADGIAIAVAAKLEHGEALAVDVQKIVESDDTSNSEMLDTEEQELLHPLDPALRNEWNVRFNCAKRAALGVLGQFHDCNSEGLIVRGFDADSGDISVICRLNSDKRPSGPVEISMTAHTTRQQDFIVATGVCERV